MTYAFTFTYDNGKSLNATGNGAGILLEALADGTATEVPVTVQLTSITQGDTYYDLESLDLTKEITVYITEEDAKYDLSITGGAEVYEGGKLTLTPNATLGGNPLTGEYEIVWTSSNTAAATVDQNGVVTGHAVDADTDVTITAKLMVDGEEVASAAHKVKVIKKVIKTYAVDAPLTFVQGSAPDKSMLTQDLVTTYNNGDVLRIPLSNGNIQLGEKDGVDLNTLEPGTYEIDVWRNGVNTGQADGARSRKAQHRRRLLCPRLCGIQTGRGDRRRRGICDRDRRWL